MNSAPRPFNVSNTPPLNDPNASFGSAAFGTITIAGNPRDYEFAGKFTSDILAVLVIAALIFCLLFQPDPAMLRHLYEQEFARQHTAQAARDLGIFLRQHGDRTAAHDALLEALRLDEEAASPQVFSDSFELALASPIAEAAPLLTRAASSKDIALAVRAWETLGHLRDATRDKAAAIECYRRGLALQENAGILEALAADLDPHAAIPILERALTLSRRNLGLRHPQTATTEANLAGQLLNAGRTQEAIRYARAALSIFEEALGPEHPRTATAATILAWGLRAAGDKSGALRYYKQALAIDRAAYGEQHPQTVADAQTLADFQREISGPP